MFERLTYVYEEAAYDRTRHFFFLRVKERVNHLLGGMRSRFQV